MLIRTRHHNWFENPFSSVLWGAPFNGLDLLRRELDQVFSRNTADVPQAYFECNVPYSSFTIEDQGSNLRLSALVPGLAENELDITVTSDLLTVKGERKLEAPEGYTKVRQERGTYAFNRSFRLPVRIDSKRVEAKLVNGILTITLPKAEEATPQKIAVLNA
jgi:HSP20 family protein